MFSFELDEGFPRYHPPLQIKLRLRVASSFAPSAAVAWLRAICYLRLPKSDLFSQRVVVVVVVVVVVAVVVVVVVVVLHSTETLGES